MNFIALLCLLYTLFVYTVAVRKHKDHPPGPPGSIEYIRWRANQEYEEEPQDEAKLRTEEEG